MKVNMKSIYILFVLLFVTISTLLSQENKELRELNMNGNIYMYEPGGWLHLKSNKLGNISVVQCEYFIDAKHEPGPRFEEIVIKVFSEERIKHFAEQKKAFAIKLICDAKGNVREVLFLLSSSINISENEENNSFSYQEIINLEKEVKKYKFKLKHTCPDVKYYPIIQPSKFTSVYKYLKEKKK